MRSFAGFWRDGAKVQPETHHLDKDKTVLAKHKKDGEFDICGIGFSGWNAVYWLDTTTPTELSPQEAFELLKTITPTLERIEKHGKLFFVYKDWISIINWGDTTEYPPKKKWRVPTDADKGKECRCKHRHDDEWKYRRIFITEFEGKYLAKDLSDNGHRRYAMCEVLDE